MDSPQISHHDFNLSFAKTIRSNDDSDPGEQLAAIKNGLPKRAGFLGNLTNSIAHSPGLTRAIDEHYFLLPWTKDGYT